MSYQIVYGPRRRQPRTVGRRSVRTGIILGILLIIALSALRFTGYGSVLWKCLLPGDPEVTISAFQDMTEEIRNGHGLSNAVTTFCETVIEGAQLGS